MTEACANCRFWEQWTEDNDTTIFGTCRRHAPRPTAHIRQPINLAGDIPGRDPHCGITCWPNTESVDWCGEYQPLTSEPKQ